MHLADINLLKLTVRQQTNSILMTIFWLFSFKYINSSLTDCSFVKADFSATLFWRTKQKVFKEVSQILPCFLLVRHTDSPAPNWESAYDSFNY